MTFLAVGHTLLLGGHVRMDVLYTKVSPKTQSLLYCISYLLVFLYIAAFNYYSFIMTLNSFNMGWKSSTNLSVPFYLPQMFIPLGAFLLLLETIVLFNEKWVEYKKLSSAE
jgi:TRAP-type mannitol/chloroaromatic compound transport system permease small subunit